MRRYRAPRFPGDLHGCGGGLGSRAEGHTGAVHGGYMGKKRTAVHDECERACLGEVEVRRVQLYVFNQYIEQGYSALRVVAEWPLG
jgi:hypothetical protein